MSENTPSPMSDSDARTWATFAHLGIVVGFLIPLGSVLTPLIIWLVYKEKSSLVADNAREALNFQITLILAFIAGLVLSIIYIGLLIIAAAGIAGLVFSILGAVAANKGERYFYPISIRFVS